MSFDTDKKAPPQDNVRKYGRLEEPEVIGKLRKFKTDQDHSFQAALKKSSIERTALVIFIISLSFWAYIVSVNHEPDKLNTKSVTFLLLISGVIANWRWTVFQSRRTVANFRILMDISQEKRSLLCVMATIFTVAAVLGYVFYEGYQNGLKNNRQVIRTEKRL